MKLIIFFIVLLFETFVFAQNNRYFNAGFFTNSQYYVDDKKTGDFNEENNFRSNNYLNLNYQINRFTIQAQFEGYTPNALLNFSPNFNNAFNIATYSLNYQNKKLNTTLGYFYDQFGSGLIFRAFEDRELGINNAVFGGLFSYQLTSFLKLKGFYGKQRKGFKLSDGNLKGANIKLSLSNLLQLKKIQFDYEFSYIARYQNVVTTNPLFNKTTNSFANAIYFSKDTFYATAEYVFKNKDALVENKTIFDARLFSGNAFLFNTGFSINSLSIDATFRRIENMHSYTDRTQRGNPFNDQLVNYIPSLTKQHDFSLANIYVYQAQPQLSFNPVGKSGEIGFQIDAFYKFKRGTNIGGKYGTQIAINYALWNGLDAIYNLGDRTYSSQFLSFGTKYYTDFNIEIRKKWSKKITTINTLMWQFYNKKWLEDSVGEINTFLILSETSYKFSNIHSTRLKLEHLQSNNDTKSWVAATFEIYVKNTSIYITDIYNYENNNSVEKFHYYNIGGSYSKSKYRFSLNYGRQRGGLVCVGGVCRLVPRTTGLSFTLNATF
ncbi:FIG00649878: hypothetical protein [hydrothermal vent metagenome]|uniref:TonB-dependent receptor n=1 Tax=hydrothermal vent metagenome TaxID=652676 RepID=A0A3B0U4B6_9ZZZZ